MKLKPSPYLIYQGTALLLMIACWAQIGLVAPTHYTLQAQDFAQSMEAITQQKRASYTQLWEKMIYQRVATQDNGYQAFAYLRPIHLRTKRLVWKIEGYKAHLAQYPAHHRKAVAQYMLHQRKAEALKTSINDFTNWIAQAYAKVYPLYDSTRFAQAHQVAMTDFSQKYFAQATVGEALAVLNHWQQYVYKCSTELLFWANQEVNYYHGYLQVGAFNTPKYVAIDDTLSADLLVGYNGIAFTKKEPYHVEINGIHAPTQPLDKVPIRFRVSGRGKKYWTGKLQYCREGIEKIKMIKTPYWVK